MKHQIVVLAVLFVAISTQRLAAQGRQPDSQSKDCCTLELPGLTAKPQSSGLTFLSDRMVEGNAQSRIRVLVFEDLQCPDCARFRKLLEGTILPKYGRHVAFEIYDFPLPKHHWARSAAVASRYLQRLAGSTVLEFRRRVAESLSRINEEGFESFFRSFLQSKSLDVRSAIRSLSDPELNRAVEADFQEGLKRDVRKTPTVIVGSRVFVEQFSGEEIATELDRILSLGGPSTHQQRSSDQTKEATEMITRRVLVAVVASAVAAESAWAGCGSRRTQQIVLTGRISAIGAESMELELERGIRTILFSERFNPAGFSTGDVVSVTCRVTAGGDFMAERIVRSGTQRNSAPAGQQPSSHKH